MLLHRPTAAFAAIGLLLGGCGTDVDPDEAAAEAWAEVFDSSTDIDTKADHLVDAEALRGTIEAYAAIGDEMGGIALRPTAVRIDGDTATITYDVTFDGSTRYEDLTGEVSRIDGDWVVSTAAFCDFMAAARTPCEDGDAATGDGSDGAGSADASS